jgi:glycosyltransferase involved in cell wall biosynthesis
MRRRLRDARFVVTISDYNRRYLVEQQPKARVELIHNSLRPAEFPFAPRNGHGEGGALRVLAVGRLVPKKGFPVLVEATAQLRDEGFPVEVRIVGEGEERDRISSLIARHDLGELVSLTGQKSQEELRGDFAWADVLVVPSVPAVDGDIDGVPVVLLEAMATGVPVIASRLSGIPEVILDSETGLLTEPGSAADLAGALRRARPPALNDFARAARKRLEANYDIDKNCRRLLRLIEKAARKAAS